SLTGAARATTAHPGGGGTMADSTLSRQTFLRLGGALGGALAATGMVAGGASAAPRPRVPAPRASGGPLLEGGEFPIGIFWPPPPYQTTVDRYRQIVDAGFTYVHSNNYLFADWQIQQHALRIADQVGLKVLVDDDDLRWITRNFRISDDGGPFTLTRDEAETLVRQIVNRYAPTRYWRLRDGPAGGGARGGAGRPARGRGGRGGGGRGGPGRRPGGAPAGGGAAPRARARRRPRRRRARAGPRAAAATRTGVARGRAMGT